jgi:predicted nucleic acid-binding protein
MPAARFFLDTNIIIYSVDTNAELRKQAIAEDLIEKALQGVGCISMQVVQECLAVLTSPKIKHGMTPSDILQYLETTLEPLAQPVASMALYRKALSIQERWKFGFYDALIVASALALDCDRLYSEDFQNGQRIEGLTVVNPFL